MNGKDRDMRRVDLKQDASMERIFNSVFNNSNEGIITIDTAGIVTSANPAALKLLKADSLPEGINVLELPNIDEETQLRLIELFRERSSAKGGRDRDLCIRYLDGSKKWVQMHSNDIIGPEGETVGFTVLISDITSRVENERKVAESAHRFKMLVESMHEGVGITDLSENIIYANKALSRLLGVGVDELIGENVASFVDEAEMDKVIEGTMDRVRGERGEYEIMVRSRNGTEKHVMISAGPWTTESGEIIGTMGLLQDITTQKMNEMALRSSEEKYRATVEQSAENIYIYDISTKIIVEANQALRNLLGYSMDEMKDLGPLDFIHHSDSDINEKIEKVMREGRAIIGERTYIRKDGELVDVEVSASLIKEDEREMLCVVSRDITEKKKAREQLIEERNKAEFYLDLLAHDIGNIHHAVIGGLNLYEMYGDDLGRKDKAVKMVSELMRRSLKLVENIMTYKKLKTSNPELMEIGLEEVMIGGYETAITSFSEKEIEHGVIWDRNDYRIKAETFVEEVFFNLYHNAINYQEGKEALVETSVIGTDDGHVLIKIADRGQGIPDIKKSTIFDRPREPTGMQHTGLGLVIIHTLVERYGGRIWVEDRVDGDHTKGSVFVIKLPVIE